MIRKKLFLALLVLSAVAAGCRNHVQELRKGDLVFVGIPLDYRIDGMADAIGAATASDSLNIIHAAIVDRERDSLFIIDATLKHGVDRHPLDTFLCDFTLNDGSLPQFFVMRLKDSRRAGEFVRNAMKFTGLSYNNSFLPCDTARYCTELIRDSYVLPDGTHVFSEYPMNFCAPDGTMPPYWEELFAILGVPVPQGMPGTNPAAMMKEPCLERVMIDITKI